MDTIDDNKNNQRKKQHKATGEGKDTDEPGRFVTLAH